MLRYDETDGSVSVFREPSQNSNGNTVDRQGRLAYRLSLTDPEGSWLSEALHLLLAEPAPL